MSHDQFAEIREALRVADATNQTSVRVSRDELGHLVMLVDRLVEAIKVAGFESIAELRRHGAPPVAEHRLPAQPIEEGGPER